MIFGIIYFKPQHNHTKDFEPLVGVSREKLNFGRGANDGIDNLFIVILRVIWNKGEFFNNEDCFKMIVSSILKNCV